MALKLTWSNLNVVPTSTRIYRKDVDFDSSSLPAPLVTLSNGETSWIDPDAVEGNTYYYILGSKTDADEVFTASQKILVADNRGVGPSVLKYGDTQLGYYGEILSADFVNSSNVLAVAASTAGLPGTLVQPTWHKFVRNNKIIYVPDQPFGSATWQYLYLAGFVYGVDANGPAGYISTGLTPTNQNRIVEFKGQKYRVRLMRGWSDGPQSDVMNWSKGGNMDTLTEATDNEFSDFIYSMCAFVALKQRTPNWNNFSIDKWVYTPLSSYDSGTINNWALQFRCVVQERLNDGSVLNRGVRSLTYGQNVGNPSTRANMTAISNSVVNQTLIWIPVLELVEQTVTL